MSIHSLHLKCCNNSRDACASKINVSVINIIITKDKIFVTVWLDITDSIHNCTVCRVCSQAGPVLECCTEVATQGWA